MCFLLSASAHQWSGEDNQHNDEASHRTQQDIQERVYFRNLCIRTPLKHKKDIFLKTII